MDWSVEMAEPGRGEVWWIDLDPTRGHEQAGRRPALVLSVDSFNQSAAGLVVVVPITSKAKGISLHVEITPPEGGIKQASYAKCEDVRSVSKQRLTARLGKVKPQTLAAVEIRIRRLLGLP
jgi:mRNA interferase MazF